MKTLLAATLLVAPCFAQASFVFMNPQVGQRVEFKLTDPDKSYLWSREILEVQATRLSLKAQKLFSESSQWEDSRYSFWSFKQLEHARDLLENCEDLGGIRETIQVPAGTFDTCQEVVEDNTYRKVVFWWANVPVIGLVKRQITLPMIEGDNLVQTVELSKI